MILDIQKIKLALARKQTTFVEILKQAHMSTLTGARINAGLEVQPKTAGKLAAALGVDVTEILKS